MLDLSVYDDEHDRLAYHVLWDFFVAPGVVRQKDGSLFRVIELRGRDLDSAEDTELLAAVNALTGILAQFGTGYTLHIEVRRRQMAAYPPITTDNPVARLIDEERRDQFLDADLYESRYFLTVTYTPPKETVARLERFFMRRAIDTRAVDVFRDVIQPFVRLTDVFATLLSEIMAYAAPLDDDGVTTYLHSTLSPVWHRVRAPVYKAWPIETVVLDTPFVPGSLPLMAEYKADVHLRTVAVMGYPEVSYPGILDGLDKLSLEYRFVQRFICLSTTDAQDIFRAIWERRKDNKYTWREFLWKIVDKTYTPEADPISIMHAM
jgi:type IV secretion system protein TrbE